MGLRTDNDTGDQVFYDSNGNEIGRYDQLTEVWSLPGWATTQPDFIPATGNDIETSGVQNNTGVPALVTVKVDLDADSRAHLLVGGGGDSVIGDAVVNTGSSTWGMTLQAVVPSGFGFVVQYTDGTGSAVSAIATPLGVATDPFGWVVTI